MIPPRNRLPGALASALVLAACDQDGQAATDPDAGLPTRVITDAAELAALPAEVPTNLTLRGEALAGALAAPHLRRVAGDLSIEADGLTELALPALREVQGTFQVGGADALVTLSVPALTRCEGLRVAHNAELVAFEAPALAEARWLELNDNRALSTVALPLLDFAPLEKPDQAPFGDEQFIHLEDNPALAELSLPALQSFVSLRVSRNTVLRRVAFPQAGGAATLSIVANHLLDALVLPELVTLLPNSSSGVDIDADSLRVLDLRSLRDSTWLDVRSASLRTLELPALVSAGQLRVLTPSLTRFSAPALRAVESLEVPSERLDQVDLSALDTGCGEVELGDFGWPYRMPACAAAALLPRCPPEALTLREDCACGAEGALSQVTCPAPASD